MILRLTVTTAVLFGESAEEWEALEKLVQLGQQTSAPRTEEWRLRGLAFRLKAPLRLESVVHRARSRGRTASKERSFLEAGDPCRSDLRLDLAG